MTISARAGILAALLARGATVLASDVPPAARFVDVTESAGIRFKHEASPTSQKYLLETMGSGVALFDYDGDGRLDLYFVNGARLADPMPPGAVPAKDGPAFANRLYRQRRDGAFDDVTDAAGVGGVGYGMGVAVGDYDNDGDADLYVTAFPRNALYRNEGTGRFTDVTERAGVGGSGWSSSAAFVDVDHDGRLDLFVARYLDWSPERNPYCGDKRPGYRAYCHPDVFPGVAPILYRNGGDGRFTDVTQQSGVALAGAKALGVAIADYDRDGDIDLLLANDSVRQFLFAGKGGGAFQEVALLAGAAVDEDGNVYAGMGVDFADYDNDGWPDIVITNLSNQKYALYRNLRDGTFGYATGPSGIGRMTLLNSGWGVRFIDFDNDGFKDLFFAQGHVLDTIELTSPHIRYRQPPLLAWNQGGRQFQDLSARAGEVFGQAWAARGLATGDIDEDGDVDVVVTTTNGRAYVLRNETAAGNRWLSVRLVGRRSNRDGIGAEIRLLGADGSLRHAIVTTAGSYLSASDRRAHFGLGRAESVKTLEVRWPSGILQRVHDVRAGRELTLTEPDGGAR